VFEYFPGNYVWNLAVVATLNNGGYIDEVDRACKPVLQASQAGSDAGTAELYASWEAVADRLIASAEELEFRGRLLGAGDTFARASLYTSQAERLQSPSWNGRNAAYQKSIDLLLRGAQLAKRNLATVEIPFGDASLPGYLVRAEGVGESQAPVIIQWNGLDSTKEMMVYSGFPDMLAKRGISTLMVDTPGSGEALRLRGLTARYDTEVWASACIDWLEDQPFVDTNQIGLVGWSLGGYYAPRAAAFEDRIKLVVAWGANHDWAAVQQARARREGEHPVPHYWDHVRWVWGMEGKTIDQFLEAVGNVRLEGICDRIRVPFLITHGAHDRQIPVAYAYKTREESINSPDLELRIFDEPEGGTEHISLDNMPVVAAYIADWIGERFTALPHAATQGR
jgi:dienelactone hydrolase